MTEVTSLRAGVPQGGGERRPRRHLTRWVAGGVLVALVAVAVVAATRPSSQATQVQSPLVGHRAPPLSGTTLTGHEFSLASERGHYVYVNFFASWCPPCQEEEPALVDFAFRQSRDGSDGARMVSVVFNDTVSDARRFVADWGIRWPVVPDSQGAIANRYGVGSPPMTFLVDPSGAVVGTWVGPVTVAQLDQMLAAARRGELFSGGAGTGND
ncbi:MAG: TlpA family protein disulfide reductase [Acidimicrobiales bacterium]|jgi:cytochrome c biogenesis protein CcmG/thiol:disulfide interchange protein DsbE